MNKNDEWFTPKWVIDKVYKVLGSIDLDPASNVEANKIVGASNIYTIEDNGLEKEWRGRVYMNPPYSAKLLKQFLNKAVEEYTCGNISECLILTNSGTDTLWNKILREYIQAYTQGRISFICGETLKEKGKGSRGQCMTYIGKNANKFIQEFSSDETFWIPNLGLI
ncbi:MAG: hypothetical protein GY810_00980 [Aureispira sp.]|nr:hypothetical protein [Aureispira sp.]